MRQLEDLRRQTEKEREVKCEEAAKELNNVRLEVESMKLDLEQRQKNVEAVLMEVLFSLQSYFSKGFSLIHLMLMTRILFYLFCS